MDLHKATHQLLGELYLPLDLGLLRLEIWDHIVKVPRQLVHMFYIVGDYQSNFPVGIGVRIR